MERTDQHTFELLVRRNQAVVCAIAYSHLRDRARSEEVAQEAFLLAWLRRGVTPPSAAWVCGIARNLARNAARRPKENAMTSETASPGPDAREQLIDHEAQERAVSALAALPDRFRDAVVLYYRGDESMAEVATALNITEAAAKKRVLRGRDRLRGALVGVERALRASRPAAAFTTAVIAAWAIDERQAAAATTVASPASVGSGMTAWTIAVIAAGGILAVGTAVVVATGATGWTTTSSPTPSSSTPKVARIDTNSSQSPSLPTPARPVLVTVTPRSHSHPTVREPNAMSPNFTDIPFRGLVQLLCGKMYMTSCTVDPSFDAIRVEIHGTDLDPLDVLDDVLAAVGAIRTDTSIVNIYDDNEGAATGAADLGGDSVTIHVANASIKDVKTTIADKLHHPIILFQTVEGDSREALERYRTAPPPTVTLDVDNVPAGVALQRVLDQKHYTYKVVTGFAIAPPSTDTDPASSAPDRHTAAQLR